MKMIKSLMIIAIALTASTVALAQKQESKTEVAKPPAVSGPVIQAPTENKVPAPPLITEKDLPQTATKQSSAVNEIKPVKETSVPKPAETQAPVLPPSNTVVPPNKNKYK